MHGMPNASHKLLITHIPIYNVKANQNLNLGFEL